MALTLRVALPPRLSATAAGWAVRVTGVFTKRTAAVLVAEPTTLLTTTSKLPALAGCTLLRMRLGPVWPGSTTPFRRHW